MGTLYVVSTPIGNLEDISKRALKVLSSVDVVLSEDTRQAAKILNFFGIKARTFSYHQHSNEEKKLNILNMLMEGKNIALVSDAGAPGVSDPGNELINFIVSNTATAFSCQSFLKSNQNPQNNDCQIKIIPVPGPSAITTALSVCGFNVNKFLFLGFWPKKKTKKTLKLIKSAGIPFVFFESPNRIVKTLNLLAEFLGGGKRVFIGRELTKIHEIHYRGSISEVIKMIQEMKKVRGEITVVIDY